MLIFVMMTVVVMVDNKNIYDGNLSHHPIHLHIQNLRFFFVLLLSISFMLRHSGSAVR